MDAADAVQQWIEQQLREAPPLTPEQVDSLRALLAEH
jgi:uncharacterized protein YneF (UPF0154 family)